MSSGPGDVAPKDQDQRIFPVTDRLLTVPNVLSMVRLAALPVLVWLLLERHLGWAGLVLVLSGVTDFLDGRIARRYGVVSRLGQKLDPIADRMYTACTLVGLVWIGLVPWWLLVVLLSRDALIVAMYPTVRRHSLPIPEVHYFGKAATFNLFAAFPLLLFGSVPGWWDVVSLATAWALVWWGTVLYWAAGAVYVAQVREMVGALAGSTGR